MKVYIVHKSYYEEEDYGGRQYHNEFADIFLSKEIAERYVNSQPPVKDDYFCTELSFSIQEREVDE